MACVFPQRTSDFEPSSETIALRYLKRVTVLSFNHDLPLNAIGAICHVFGLFSTHSFYTLCRSNRDFQLGPLFPAVLQDW